MVRGFTRFKEGDDDRGFPDGRDVGRLKGKVVKFGEVGEGRWTKVFKMEDNEVIRTMEVELEEREMASWTIEELKGVKEGSWGCLERILRIRRRVVGLDLWRK